MTNLLNWFKKPEKSVVKFLYTGMDLKTWRDTPEFLSFARELWGRAEWQHALSALRNAAPTGFPMRARPITEADGLIELGRKEGYDDCMRAIFSLPIRTTEQVEEVEADFDPKDYSKEIE